MKWERRLARNIITIILQTLVARFVYHLFAEKQPNESQNNKD